MTDVIFPVSRFLSAFILLVSLSHGLQAEDHIEVVVAADAPQLERYAAAELVTQFQKLFDDAKIQQTTQTSSSATHVVLIGSPTTNAAVAAAVGSSWPKLSDQGFVLRSVNDDEPQTIVIGGDTPVATMWAAYELTHRLGVRYLVRGDIFPNETEPLTLSGIDVVMEPELRSRTWQMDMTSAAGPVSWSHEEQIRLLRQLARMKYNRLMLSVESWQPFVTYEFGGVRKQTAALWWEGHLPVDGDTVGKKAFQLAEFFENPDFSGLTTTEEMTVAGVKHLSGLINSAHELGMTVGISIAPLEFPIEFQKVLSESQAVPRRELLSITPGAADGPDSQKLQQLATAQIRAWLQTYPRIDTLSLRLPMFRVAAESVEQAAALLTQYDVTDDAAMQLLEVAKSRKSAATAEQSLVGSVAGFVFLKRLLADKTLLDGPDNADVDLVISDVDPGLFPVLTQSVPSAASTLEFIGDTVPDLIDSHLQSLQSVPVDRYRNRLTLNLDGDNVGVLPQARMTELETLMDEIKRLGWDGLSTQLRIPAEQDPSVYFLSRAAWQKQLTAEDAFRELWTTATGNAAAAERLWLGWQQVEKANDLIERHFLRISALGPDLWLRHYTAEPVSASWTEITDAYTEHMVELYRAQGAIDGGAQPILFYYAKRGEYVLAFLEAMKAVREAALANQEGDTEQALEHLEVALESTYNCINTLSDVARDQSDRGLIALLNAYAYRPLLAEYERLSDQ